MSTLHSYLIKIEKLAAPSKLKFERKKQLGNGTENMMKPISVFMFIL